MPASSTPAAVSAAPARARPVAAERRPARARGVAGRGRFGRFLTLSLVLHALLVAGGLTGGAMYARRSGAEARDATILFAAAAEPVADDVPPQPAEAAEPAPPLETAELPDEPALVEQAAEPAALPGPVASDSDLLAGAPALASAAPREIGDVLGDPTTDWKLASEALPGLELGAAAPHVSDCCGEPQPSPDEQPAREEYSYPVVLHMERAEYPERSQRFGEQGSVLLEMTVGDDGLVKGVVVVASSGHARLDECAVDAAWGWIFKPALRNGRPEVALARHRYTFRVTTVRG